MGGINPVQLGGYGTPSGGGNGGGLLGFLANTISGLHAGNEQRRAVETEKLENQTKQAQLKIDQQNADLATQKAPYELQELKAKASSDQMAAAQGKLEALKPALFTNGNLQSDPSYVQSVKDSYQALGLPAPIKIGKDGKESIDVSSWKKPFASLDQKQQTAILSMSPEQRKPVLDQLVRAGYDVDKNLYKATAVVDAKEARLRSALTEKTRHDKATEGSYTQRTKIQKQLADAREADDYATISLIEGKTRVANETAAAIPARVQQAQQKIGLESQKLKLSIDKFHASPHTQQTQMITAASDALRSYNQVNSDLVRLNASKLAATANGADADTLVDTQNQIDDLKSQLAGFKELHTQAMSALKSGMAGASAVSASSGNNTSVVPKNLPKPVSAAPSGVADGYYPDAKGGAVTVKGGQVYKGQI
jgi:hypothetical protein